MIITNYITLTYTTDGYGFSLDSYSYDRVIYAMES